MQTVLLFSATCSFNFMFRHIDGVLSLTNYRLGDFVDCIELEINDITDTYMFASYIDLHLEIDIEGRLRTKLYDKRDDFPIVKFPIICSNISAVFLSQLIDTIFQTLWTLLGFP